ncbi:MAG: 2Fe-2S iron-sulfur cluster binding domain-containing protein [Rhodococcus sp.]|nr:2Fe-2S iron-sulfur cluster binding domain-containing protein [Rhodococcus sp. (in: high G+C Gram-positive bacteria)]
MTADVRTTPADDTTPGLADELLALYTRAKSEVGESDLAHIRNVTAYGQAIEARRLELLRVGTVRSIRRAAALEMLYRLMQFSELGHNIIHGSYDHLPNNGDYHSERYRWDFNVDVDHWKTMHHVGHHPNTNIVDKDHDLGYSIMRGLAGQDWYGHHIGQTAIVGTLATFAPQAAPFFLANVARQVEGKRFFSSYTLRSPAAIALRDAKRRYFREPRSAGSKLPQALVANYLGGVAGYMSVLFLVFIEHHAGELELFADPGPDETADQYYERQIRATRNFLPSPRLDDALERILLEEVPFENRPGMNIFYGGLDTHIEHHLFPDLPPTKQREIAPEVRAIAARHGLPYHEIPLLDTVPLVAKTLARLSAPVGESEFGHSRTLLAHPATLARRLAYGIAYKALPEAPYLNKPRFHNAQVKVVGTTSVADGAALSVQLEKPRGWDDVRWEAGAFVSIRAEVEGEDLVRQYSLVHDSDSSDLMEICIKRVEDGRVSNRLNGELRAGKYVTLVGVPSSTGDFAVEAAPRKSLFIAGGVGITPIISVLRRIVREAPDSDAVLLYFNKDDRSIIFERELRELARTSGVTVHLFTSAPSRRGDIIHGRLSLDLIRDYVSDGDERETYACAPPAMVDLARGWMNELGLTTNRFHAESFTPPELERPVDDGSRYTVRFRRSGSSVEIDGATTLLEAATRVGIRVPTGCERGLCRACVTPKLNGVTRREVDGPQLERVTVCNSMACSDIELDL